MWSIIEACASVICANLPFYAPLLKKGFSLVPLFTSLRSVFSFHKKDRSRSVSSKWSMRKETSSLERIIREPIVVGCDAQDDTKDGDQGPDIEMRQIRPKTMMDDKGIAEASEPPVGGASRPCLPRPCPVCSERLSPLGSNPTFSNSNVDRKNQGLERHHHLSTT